MKKIPTAKEFALLFTREHGMDDTWLENLMIEFTKLHLKEARYQIKEKIIIINDFDRDEDYSPYVDENSILNAYPEDNIK